MKAGYEWLNRVIFLRMHFIDLREGYKENTSDQVKNQYKNRVNEKKIPYLF